MAIILIVDDRQINREVLASVLSGQNHELLEADDGMEALAVVRTRRPDLVISDLLMPRMDGYELLRSIRADPVVAATRVIFYTAKYNSEEAQELAKAAGTVQYLAKPSEPAVILRTVEESLAAAAVTHAAAVDGDFGRAHLRLLTDKLASQVYELERTNERLTAALALGHQLAPETAPDEHLRQYCRAACEIVGGSYGGVLLLDDQATDLRLYAAVGFEKQELPYGPPAVARSLLARLVRLRTPVRFYRDDSHGLDSLPDCHPPVASLLCAPVGSANTHFGVCYVAGKLGGQAFTEDDERIAVAIGAKLAVAYENARLYREVHDLAEERAALLASERAAREAAEATYLTAQKASRMKDEFLATVSHELRTPLNVILGHSELLPFETQGTAEFAESLDTIIRNAKSQADLIDDLLDVSRIITGKLTLSPQKIDLATLIKHALDAFAVAARATEITFTTNCEPGVGLVYADPERFGQVLWNLLSNALKFSARGSNIQIDLHRVDGDAQIDVRDFGRGIDPEFLPYVFERFRQEDGSSTRRFGGLGLGLAIVRHIVEAHGGTISAQSEGRDMGATFSVRVPCLVSDAAALASPADGTDAGARLLRPNNQFPQVLQGARVLVVDDQIDARYLLRSILKRAGAQVTIAGSAMEAMALLQKETPDILVSDIGMPGDDGHALVRQIRSSRSTALAEIPAVALTAYANDEDRQRAIDAGFQMHFTKPLRPLPLIAALADLLAQGPVVH